MWGRLRATSSEDVSNNFVQELQETASEEQFANSLKESRDIRGRKLGSTN
jgi:hypothetical protein